MTDDTPRTPTPEKAHQEFHGVPQSDDWDCPNNDPEACFLYLALRAQRETGVLEERDLIVKAVAPFLRPSQIRKMPPFFRDLFMEYGAKVLTEAPDAQD